MECDPIRRQPLGTDYVSPTDYIFKDSPRIEATNNKNDRKEELGGFCMYCGEARMVKKTPELYQCPSCSFIMTGSG